MGIMKKLGKSGMFGLAGLAASKKGMVDKIARNGGLGLVGMALAKKKAAQGAGASGMRGRPMVEDIMMAEEAPAGAPMMKKGGKVSAAEAVHKHERAKHKGQPLTKMAKGGSTASKRADGCATKGKTKGRFV
jgi:hypothetical protein